MSAIKIIFFFIANAGTIVRIIKEILDLVGQLTGDKEADEVVKVESLKKVAADLGDRARIPHRIKLRDVFDR